MPRGTSEIQQVESWQPQIDYRKSGQVGVLAGRNFSWDASGVRADFASAKMQAGLVPFVAVDGFTINRPFDSVSISGAIAILANNKINKPQGGDVYGRGSTFDSAIAFTDLLGPSSDRRKYQGFTSANIGSHSYFSSYRQGTYRCQNGNYGVLDATRMTPVLFPGFPDEATTPTIAIAGTNARLVILNHGTVTWSGPGNGADYVPALGGAGFQTLAGIGIVDPYAMYAIPEGVVIFASSGVYIGEFIGGPFVFRWYPAQSRIKPATNRCVGPLTDGSYIMLTETGLYQLDSAREPVQVSPLFNEFLKAFYRFKDYNRVRLWISQPDNRVFIAEHDDSGVFNLTLCLDLDLDKWGVFSDPHRGMVNLDLAGYEPPTARATRPAVLGYLDPEGYMRVMLPFEAQIFTKELSSSPGVYTGLDSSVTIGYLRDERLVRDSNSLQTLTDLTVLHNLTRNGNILIVDEGAVGIGESMFESDGLLGDGFITYIDDGVIGETTAVIAGYWVRVMSDYVIQDDVSGEIYGIDSAFLVNNGEHHDTWTANVTGHYLSLEVLAKAPGEAFRIKAVQASMAFAGQAI